MKPPVNLRTRRAKSRGIALVIVLAFIVLLVGVALAFFVQATASRKLSDSSSNQVKADELARSALNVLTSDLKREIVNGSSASKVGDVTIYLPTSTSYSEPQTNGISSTTRTNTPTLLRVSSAAPISSPGVTQAASSINSTNVSQNGRYISPARWNKPLLIAPTATNDYTPAAAVAFTPPAWIYVTDQGPQTLTNVVPGVLGRYSYAIYNEGALLDVNTAGYPSALPLSGAHPSPDPHNFKKYGYGGKGFLAFADLTQLGLTSPQVDGLVGWRNYATAQPSGNFPAFTFNAAASAGFFDNVLTNTNGFLKISTTVRNGNRTDQAVLSRQQLLDLRRSLGIDPAVMQYLGTFSRSISQPTWKPTTPADSSVDYAAIANASTSANRDVLGLRMATFGTITHYDDAGNAVSLPVKSGDVLLQRRFSLAKLAWLTHTGPAAGISDAAIQACFGLKWNNARARWDYVGPTGSAPQASIKTLGQVLAENREPNFFELLKAGILSGSLGKQPGAKALGPMLSWGTGPTTTPHVDGPLGSDFDSYSAQPDYQIARIGANLIDQADADNYPTAIYLNILSKPFYTATGEEELFNTAFGTENIPYLTRMGTITALIDRNSPIETMSSWLQPELWNPHQNTDGASYPIASTTPVNLRLLTYGECYAQNTVDAGYPQGDPIIFGAGTTQGEIDITNSGTFFGNPVALTTAQATSPTTRNLSSNAGTAISFTSNPFVAVFTGTVQRINPLTPPGSPINRVMVVPDSYLTFVLQYNDGSSWHPYAMMARIGILTSQSYASGTPDGLPEWKVNSGRPDPRTDRFSASSAFDTGAPAGQKWPRNDTMRWAATGTGAIVFGYPLPSAGFVYGPGNSKLNNPNSSSSSNNALQIEQWAQNVTTQNFYYPDPDGVVRVGDGWQADYTTGDGVMSYLQNQLPATAYARRPVILNRPFRSVGEMGYAYRDLPFKTLDLWSPNSADAGLLDLFSVSDEPIMVSGKFDPNAAPTKVLQAVLAGSFRNEAQSLMLDPADAQSVSAAIRAQLDTAPLSNPADLAASLGSAIRSGFAASSSSGATISSNKGNKTYAEAPMRALSSVSNLRTWNLLIDVVAQTGIFPPGTTALDRFVVQGERRYWLHLAIDRLTGEVIDQQLEAVYE